MHHPTDRITHSTAFCYTSRAALAGTRKIMFNLMATCIYLDDPKGSCGQPDSERQTPAAVWPKTLQGETTPRSSSKRSTDLFQLSHYPLNKKNKKIYVLV